MFGKLSGYVFLPFFGCACCFFTQILKVCCICMVWLLWNWPGGPLLYIYMFCFLHRHPIEACRPDYCRSPEKNPMPVEFFAWKAGIEFVGSPIHCYVVVSNIFYFHRILGEDFPFWPPTRLWLNISQFYGFHVGFPCLWPTHLGHWHIKRGSAEDALVSKAAKQRRSCQGRCLLNFFDREFAKRSPKGCFS